MPSSELSEREEIEDQFDDSGFEKHKLKTTISKMFGKISSPASSPVANDDNMVVAANNIKDMSQRCSVVGKAKAAWKRFRNANVVVPDDRFSRNVI